MGCCLKDEEDGLRVLGYVRVDMCRRETRDRKEIICSFQSHCGHGRQRFGSGLPGGDVFFCDDEVRLASFIC